MSRVPIARIRDLDATFMQDGSAAVTWGAFFRHAHRLAEQLPPGSHVLNLCEGRYAFTVGFVAALIAERITVLPSTVGSTLGELPQYYPVGCALIDEGRPSASRAADEEKARPLSLLEVPGISRESLDSRTSCAEIPAIEREQRACIVFSSGSTGLSTAHLKRWGTLAQAGIDIGVRFGFAPGRQSIVSTVPSRHMFGLETTLALPLQWGSCVHAGRPLLPADVDMATRALAGERWLMTTPIQLRALADDGLCRAAFEAVVSATMPLSESLAALVEQRFGASVHEIYGCTEAGSLATRRTTRFAEWETLDGIAVEEHNGSAWVSGGHVAEPTPLADIIGLVDARHFRLRGRAAHLVKVGGKRASLEALNAVLNQIPGVLDGSFFMPEAASDTGTRLIAFVVAPGLTASHLVAELRERLDPVFVPRPLYLVSRLPRNDLGKLSRRDLADMAGRLCGANDAVRG